MYKPLFVAFFVLVLASTVSAALIASSYPSEVPISQGEERKLSFTLQNLDDTVYNISINTDDFPSSWNVRSLQYSIGPKENAKVVVYATAPTDATLPEYLFNISFEYSDKTLDLPITFLLTESTVEPVVMNSTLSPENGYLLVKSTINNNTNHDFENVQYTVDVPNDWRTVYTTKNFTLHEGETRQISVKLYSGETPRNNFTVSLLGGGLRATNKVSHADILSSEGALGLFTAGQGSALIGLILLITVLTFKFKKSDKRPSRRKQRRDQVSSRKG